MPEFSKQGTIEGGYGFVVRLTSTAEGETSKHIVDHAVDLMLAVSALALVKMTRETIGIVLQQAVAFGKLLIEEGGSGIKKTDTLLLEIATVVPRNGLPEWVRGTLPIQEHKPTAFSGPQTEQPQSKVD